MNKKYQELDSMDERIEMVKILRRDLAMMLAEPNPKYNDERFYWETVANGQFVTLMLQELLSEQFGGKLIMDNQVDYSLPGLQRLLNSNSWIGDEVIQYVAEILNIDIYILLATQQDLYPTLFYKCDNVNSQKIVDSQAIVLIGNEEHYEVVAINTPTGFQTVFNQNTPFIIALDKKFKITTKKKEIYNPDRFVGTYTEIFGNKIDKTWKKRFGDDDPFTLLLEDYKEEILSS